MDDALRLIVIDDSSNKTEVVTSILRNAGHVVRSERIEDAEDLLSVSRKEEWDMILACTSVISFTPGEALNVTRTMERALPLIVIADDESDAELNALLEAGARDVVKPSNPLRLTTTLLREAEDSRLRGHLRNCEIALLEANQRAQLLVDSSRDAITYIHEGMHIFANESYLNMFGFSDPDEIAGMPILNMVSKQDHAGFKKFLRDYGRAKAGENSFDATGVKPDGSQFCTTLEFSHANFEGEPCIQVIIRDQAASADLAKKLDDMSRTDLLTGAYNRQFFLDAIEKTVLAPDSEGAVLYIAPDNYDEMKNDIGIAASDQMLSEFAYQVQRYLPAEGDFLSRFENECFTAILNNAEAKQAEAVAAAIVKAIDDASFKAGGNSVHATSSIGIALFNSAFKDPQEVLGRAEKARLKAKQGGGNRFTLYTPDASEMVDLERAAFISNQIKSALKNNRFNLLFQPIVSISGDEAENYEVFLRMQDEEGNELNPADFIGAAQKGGLMVAIDRWVLAHSIKVAATERKNGRNLHFFIKLSGDSLQDPKLLPWLRDLLRAANLDAGSLTLEVSEKVAKNNLKSLKALLTGLQMLHVRLAIDHFGIAENYNNLLKHSGAHAIKLDASLITNISKDPAALEKVRAISAEAKSLNAVSIAVSVEDPNTLATIYSTGVDYIQGYFLQPPNTELNFDFSTMG